MNALEASSAPPPVLRIGEVARRAGVAPSVITFYLAQGLLPPPKKTSRNMAWYGADTVEWVRLIRELQEKAFLPLRVVKRVLASGSSPDQVREYFAGRSAAPAAHDIEPVTEAALVTEGFPAAALRKLEQIGVVHPRELKGKKIYGADDTALVRELGRMQAAGLSSQRGFDVEQLRVYVDAMETVAQKEIEFAIEGLVGSMRPDVLAARASSWLASANTLLCLLHKKALKRRVRELGTRMTAPADAVRKRTTKPKK